MLIGVGAGGGFAPLMADISHWFVKKRGLAVVVVASGNYLAGGLWPLVMNAAMPQIGWRGTYVAIGLVRGDDRRRLLFLHAPPPFRAGDGRGRSTRPAPPSTRRASRRAC